MSQFNEMDFAKNSRDILVVRAIRVRDIMKALRCSLSFAYQVIKEIRGDQNPDGSLAFVLPSQLAAWVYKRAGGKAERPLRPRGGEGLPSADVLARATSSTEGPPIHVTTPRTKPRGKR
jgi:hypothetical protein